MFDVRSKIRQLPSPPPPSTCVVSLRRPRAHTLRHSTARASPGRERLNALPPSFVPYPTPPVTAPHRPRDVRVRVRVHVRHLWRAPGQLYCLCSLRLSSVALTLLVCPSSSHVPPPLHQRGSHSRPRRVPAPLTILSPRPGERPTLQNRHNSSSSLPAHRALFLPLPHRRPPVAQRRVASLICSGCPRAT